MNFCRELECVKCRKINKPKKLYWHSKKLVEPWLYTIEYLKDNIHRMDVWCDDCEIKINKRMMGEGRYKHKLDASEMASIRLRTYEIGSWDKNVLPNGSVATKEQLITMIKSTKPCFVCKNMFHPCGMDFHHVNKETKVSTIGNMMTFNAHTFNSLIQELQKCVLVCAVCHRYITHKVIDSPTETIILDEEFWNQFYEYLNQPSS